MMALRIAITVNALVFIVVVPMLEVGPSHVFNPAWPGHARLHEVWQLMTNAALGIFALWLTWRSSRVQLAGGLTLLMSAPFVAAYLIQNTYGGSMTHADGTELTVLGVNSAFGVLLLLSTLIAILMAREMKRD